RVATVATIGLATVAAAIGAGGLGVLIYRGIATVDDRLILAGAVPAAPPAVGAGARPRESRRREPSARTHRPLLPRRAPRRRALWRGTWRRSSGGPAPAAGGRTRCASGRRTSRSRSFSPRSRPGPWRRGESAWTGGSTWAGRSSATRPWLPESSTSIPSTPVR